MTGGSWRNVSCIAVSLRGAINFNALVSNTIVLADDGPSIGIELIEGDPAFVVSDLLNGPDDEVDGNTIEGNHITTPSSPTFQKTGILIAGGTGNIIRDDGGGTPNRIQLLTQGGTGLPAEGGGIVLVNADNTEIGITEILVTSPGIVMINQSGTATVGDVHDVTISSVGVGMMMFGSEDIELVDVDITASQIGLYIQANFLHLSGQPIDPRDFPAGISIEGLQVQGSGMIGVLGFGIVMDCWAGAIVTNDISVKAGTQDTVIRGHRGIQVTDCRGVTIDDTQLQRPVVGGGQSGIELIDAKDVNIGLTGPVTISKEAGAPNGYATAMVISGGSNAITVEDLAASDLQVFGMVISGGSNDITVKTTSFAGIGLGFSTGIVIINSQGITFEGQDSPPLVSGFVTNVKATDSGTQLQPVQIISSTLGAPVGVIDLQVGANAFVDTVDTNVADRHAHSASGGGQVRVRWVVDITGEEAEEFDESIILDRFGTSDHITRCAGLGKTDGSGIFDSDGNCFDAEVSEIVQDIPVFDSNLHDLNGINGHEFQILSKDDCKNSMITTRFQTVTIPFSDTCL